MNFTWFASAFDCDDAFYRVLTLVQMAGVLVLAAGVGPAFEESDYRTAVLGYVIMRGALVIQWLRVAIQVPAYRTERAALRHRDHRGADPVGRPAVPGGGSVGVGVPAVRRPRAAHPGLGGPRQHDAVASAPHRRALRAVHDHRPRRERAGHGDRVHRQQGRGRGVARPGRRRRVWARPAVRVVVAVLPAGIRPGAGAPPLARLPVGLRALLRVRVTGGGRRRHRGRHRGDHPRDPGRPVARRLQPGPAGRHLSALPVVPPLADGQSWAVSALAHRGRAGPVPRHPAARARRLHRRSWQRCWPARLPGSSRSSRGSSSVQGRSRSW